MITKDLNISIKQLGKVDKSLYTICLSTKDKEELNAEVGDKKKYRGFDVMVIDLIEYGEIYITKLTPKLNDTIQIAIH